MPEPSGLNLSGWNSQADLAKVFAFDSAKQLSAALGHEIDNAAGLMSGEIRRLHDVIGQIDSDTDIEILKQELLGLSSNLNNIVPIVLSHMNLLRGYPQNSNQDFEIQDFLDTLVSANCSDLDGVELETDIAKVPEGVKLETNMGLLLDAAGTIVRNAVRHAKDGEPSKASVKIDIDFESDGIASGLVIKVFDSGSKIPEPVQQRMWDFGRSDSGGNGIGLSLARGYVEAMGGSVSYKGTGAKHFEIRVPVNLIDQQVQDPNSVLIPKVILIDDTIGIRQLMKVNLEAAQLEVQDYEGLDAAIADIDSLKAYKTGNPILVVSDWRLPGHQGPEAYLEALKDAGIPYKVLVIAGEPEAIPMDFKLKYQNDIILEPLHKSSVCEDLSWISQLYNDSLGK